MERQMLSIRLIEDKSRSAIRERTEVEDIKDRIDTFKWKLAGHNSRQKDGRPKGTLLGIQTR